MLRRTIAGVLIACLPQVTVAQDRPTVVAVNYALQFIAEQLVDGEADVVFPVPTDVDPAFWRPAIADISMIQAADLILLNGGGFATWVDRVSLPRAKLVNTTAQLEDQFIVTESITHSHGDGGEHSHEGVATYTWLDPLFAAAQAEVVADAITSRGLADEGDVNARLAVLQADLAALDSDARAALAPAQDIAMITTHPRYQYFAQSYDLNMTALEWEAGVMPSDDELAALEDLVAQTGARVLVWEAAPPEPAIEATAALGLQSVVFLPLVHKAADGDFATAFAAGVEAIAQAALAASDG